MSFEEKQNLYDLLDLTPDASAKEVQEAYFRAKTAYSKDSLALYTLISAEEREQSLRAVEEAYRILSNSSARKNYDECHGYISVESPDVASADIAANANPVASIDRVPPMETLSDSSSILIPPTTEFASTRPAAPTSNPGSLTPAQKVAILKEGPLAQELAREIEWRGPLLRRIRESLKLSLEELAAQTKISKTYILAIENEDHAKLPAAVYLRGFVIQLAKIYKLDVEKVSAAYLARYFQARPDQRH